MNRYEELLVYIVVGIFLILVGFFMEKNVSERKQYFELCREGIQPACEFLFKGEK